MGDARTAGLLILALSAGLPASSGGVRGTDPERPVYPAAGWEKRTPEQVGLSAEKLKALGDLTGGRGCVVRQGYLVYSWGDHMVTPGLTVEFARLVNADTLSLATTCGHIASGCEEARVGTAVRAFLSPAP